MSGMIRGSGQQAKAVLIVIFSYCVVGVPVALLLGFKTSLGVSSRVMCLQKGKDCLHASSCVLAHACIPVWLFMGMHLACLQALMSASIATRLRVQNAFGSGFASCLSTHAY